jgi:hypothetical protein
VSLNKYGVIRLDVVDHWRLLKNSDNIFISIRWMQTLFSVGSGRRKTKNKIRREIRTVRAPRLVNRRSSNRREFHWRDKDANNVFNIHLKLVCLAVPIKACKINHPERLPRDTRNNNTNSFYIVES